LLRRYRTALQERSQTQKHPSNEAARRMVPARPARVTWSWRRRIWPSDGSTHRPSPLCC